VTRKRSDIDRTRAIVSELALAGLARLFQGGTPCPDSAVEVSGGWTMLVSVFPSPTDHPVKLNDCERDCLTLLSLKQEHLSAARICKELENRDIGVYAEITIKRSLARLHKQLRLICNSRKRPRGYFLPDKLPLFLRRDPSNNPPN
jgi:hypothetical protein